MKGMKKRIYEAGGTGMMPRKLDRYAHNNSVHHDKAIKARNKQDVKKMNRRIRRSGKNGSVFYREFCDYFEDPKIDYNTVYGRRRTWRGEYAFIYNGRRLTDIDMFARAQRLRENPLPVFSDNIASLLYYGLSNYVFKSKSMLLCRKRINGDEFIIVDYNRYNTGVDSVFIDGVEYESSEYFVGSMIELRDYTFEFIKNQFYDEYHAGFLDHYKPALDEYPDWHDWLAYEREDYVTARWAADCNCERCAVAWYVEETQMTPVYMERIAASHRRLETLFGMTFVPDEVSSKKPSKKGSKPTWVPGGARWKPLKQQ